MQLGPPGLKDKKKYKLDVQMRRMNWNRIQRQQVQQGSFWQQANEDAFASQDLFLDLEKTFATGRGKLLVSLSFPPFLPSLVPSLILSPFVLFHSPCSALCCLLLRMTFDLCFKIVCITVD